VQKRPRLTVFDDFGGRIPSDKPPIKTPGELAIERGEPWPQPIPEPAFKKAIAQASAAHTQQIQAGNGNGTHSGGQHPPGRHQAPNGPTQPDYGAPAGWRAPGWPPPPQQGYWHPPPPGWNPPAQHGRQPYPPPAPSTSGPAPQEGSGDEAGRSNHSS
jgi:cell division protease FtsH